MRSRLRVLLACALSVSALSLVACSKDPVVVAQQHADRGDRYMQQRQYPEAIVEYRAAVQSAPRNGDDRRKLAEAYDRLPDPMNAYREYVRAADLLPDNPDLQVKAGIFLLAAGHFEDAQTRARSALAKNPRHVDALLLLGQAAAGLKDKNGAVARIEEALRIDPDRTSSYASLGQMQLAQGNLAQAERAFNSAVKLAPNSIEANLAMADFFFSSGRPEQADSWYRKALALGPKDPRTNRAMASYFFATKRETEAEAYLKVAAEPADQPRNRLVLADYYYAVKRTADARQTLNTLLKDDSVYSDVKLRLAVIEYVENHPKTAYQRIDEVLAKDPRDVLALVLKGRFLFADHKTAAALPVLTAAAEAGPNSTPAHYWLGTTDAALGRTDDAVKELKRVLDLDANHVGAMIGLAELNLLHGDAPTALALAERATIAQPNDAMGHVVLVKALLAQGDLRRAQTESVGLLRRFADVPDAQVAAGLVLAASRDLPNARRAFEQALHLAPNTVDAVAGLVGIDIALGHAADANAMVQARLKDNPNDPKLLRLAAQVYGAQGDPVRQEQTLRKIVGLDPVNLGAYADLAHVFLSQGKTEETRREYEAILARDPNNVPIMTVTALMLQVQGHRAEAIKRYEDVLAVDSRAGIAANNLAMLYAESGQNLDVALRLAQTATSALPDAPQVNDTLGWIYYLKGLAASAIPPLERSVKGDPNSPITQYHLALAYAKTGDKAKARNALERALKISGTFDGADAARKLLATLRG